LVLKEAITWTKESKGSCVLGVYVVSSYFVTLEIEFITVEQVGDSMREEGKEILKMAQKKWMLPELNLTLNF